jgi:para-nitrobenzyl esterase
MKVAGIEDSLEEVEGQLHSARFWPRYFKRQRAESASASVYELTRAAPVGDGVMGGCHGLDESLVFGTFDAHLGPMLPGPESPPDAVALTARFRRTWATFATTGDQGWPAYDSQRRLVQILDSEPLVTAYPGEASRRLWRDYTFAALPLLGA